MIKFTRYSLPSGRKTPDAITIDPKTDQLGNELIELGIAFSVEILTTGMIALYAINKNLPDAEEQELCYISQNGPEIIDKVKDMINEASERWNK